MSLEEKFLPICAGLAHCKDVLCKAELDLDAVHFVVQQGRLWLLGPAPTPTATTATTASNCDSDLDGRDSFQASEASAAT